MKIGKLLLKIYDFFNPTNSNYGISINDKKYGKKIRIPKGEKDD